VQTSLADFIKDTHEGKVADVILRKCVHCGFCTATCPTYQLLGDELDGPRGRIYLIKQVLEGAPASSRTQTHLDRCLTCRACETTCPSGVEYGHLADIGRAVVEAQVGRPLSERLKRSVIRRALASPRVFDPLLKLGQAAAPLLPGPLKSAIPAPRPQTSWAPIEHHRRMLVLDGCVQPSIAPNINAAASRVLHRLGISLVRVPEAGCCGALDFHLNAHARARQRMRALIDAFWPQIEDGAEAIVFTASGCGVMLKDYAHVLAQDSAYLAKAVRIAAVAKDLSEVLANERTRLAALARNDVHPPTAAFHSPCTLQHGLRAGGVVESLLRDLGFTLTAVPDAHLCCGSAGTYAIFQPKLAQELRARKLSALASGRPEVVLTANIGCLTHLSAGSALPVQHWIEALDEQLVPLASDERPDTRALAESGSRG
jgi:glycolate oxidase iron-sulfur subunit